MNSTITLKNEIDGSLMDKLNNEPEKVRTAEIRDNKLYLVCNSNVLIFAGDIKSPDMPVKGIKFTNDKIKITL